MFIRSGQEGEVPVAEMWPLQEGNTWYYQVEGSSAKDEVMVTVLKEQSKGNEQRTYRVGYDYQTHQTVETYTRTEDGLAWERIDNPLGQYERRPEQYLIKQPVGEHLSWEWDGELVPIGGQDIQYNGEAVITQEGFYKVDLPIGKHEGVKVINRMDLNFMGQRREIRDKRVYVPEIGLVKQEVEENGELRLKKLLTNYHLGNNRD